MNSYKTRITVAFSGEKRIMSQRVIIEIKDNKTTPTTMFLTRYGRMDSYSKL